MRTEPPIAEAQNRPEQVRRVAAQAQAYSEAKKALWIRLVVVGCLSVAVAVAAAAGRDGGMIGTAGGILLLFLNAAAAHLQQRRSEFAASVQEAFDCDIFQLNWNDTLLLRRPSGQEVALVAERYAGSRHRDWYPDVGEVLRPLDVLICQQSNVGWGAPVHRYWAYVIAGIAALFAGILICLWAVLNIPFDRALGIFVAPFLPVIWEAIEMSVKNFVSAREKEETQALILRDWDQSMASGKIPPLSRCRSFQDAICLLRRRNAQVPDWFDKALRNRNERAMRTSADEMIEQAKRAGLT